MLKVLNKRGAEAASDYRPVDHGSTVCFLPMVLEMDALNNKNQRRKSEPHHYCRILVKDVLHLFML